MTGLVGGLVTNDEPRTGNRVRTALVGVAILLTAALGGLRLGAPGVLAGASLAVAWLVIPPIVVFALGQILVAASVPADASLATLFLVEAPLFLLVVGDLVSEHAPLRTLVVGVVALTAVSSFVVASLAVRDALWQTGTLLVCAVALVSYGLHRYTVATLEVPDGV